MHTVGDILVFLRRLESAGIYFEVTTTQPTAISVLVTVPGERWEVDFHEDGSISVERFMSDGSIFDEEAIAELLAKFSN